MIKTKSSENRWSHEKTIFAAICSYSLSLKEKEPARGHGSSFMIHPRFVQSSSTLEKPFQCGEAVFSELAFCFIDKR
ncbi:hypothetical protein BRO54_0835 [Geobacillus proteiniphilus]|uniref:Uncharacterized protein n=1 Tax=Geobacillus proteiniphilus TaxID=860353 RepID=A0A1Q5T5A2_9BACL|nr:hypothetical protein BRO54_0835 [Geobacillus proteiniphilus]